MKWLIQLYRVHGRSMQPALPPGKILIATGWFKEIHPQDLVVVRHDGLEKIKRLQQIEGDKIFVAGDNTAESTDSRQFGWLPRKAVVMKVLWPRVR